MDNCIYECFFFRMLVGLEHGILICVSMELQRRGGRQSECELSIRKYGVYVLGFVCVCVCVCVCVFFGIGSLMFL